ncbi:snf2 family helicase atpase [Diplodia corticola]|uniref:Snf2 family helicase atpase n=1 Tax=Diplodia corticola TaxID=236234 RepID=A0A1J9RTA6_9PEZI|nr:snf2 family helicase atpase [Diplodia corticola]OJD31655.1 snf2 family helicase atpase [Diplodia corticola]
MSSASDPLDWSVEDIVDALCRSRGWWIQGRPNSPMPDPVPLEKHLREEEVDGFALLTYFTSEQRLKDGLGIKTIGRVSALCWAIDKLREQSPKYAEHLATQTALSAPQSMAQSMAGSSTYGRPVGGWLGSLPPPSEHVRTGLATPTHEGVLPTVLEAEEEMNGEATVPVDQIVGPVDPATMTAKRPGETLIQDASGRKKRKLTLTAVSTASKKPDSVQPEPRLSRSTQKSLPVDEIFYGDTSFGQTLEDDDDMDFQHYGEAHHFLGPYVYRQYLHYIRNPDRRELLQGNGKISISLQPYRSAIVPDNRPRSVTVFEHTDNGIKATRQDALRVQRNAMFDSSLPYHDDENEENSGWYGLAEKWALGDDKVLPPLGESDDEEYNSSYEAELDAEERERTLQQSKQAQLSKEEVSTIIQERIHDLVEIWKQKKLPLRQRTAKTTWRKARRPGERRLLRMAAADEVRMIDRRLDKLKEAMMDEVWHKREEVIRQCATLEESVSQREEKLWRISIWDLKVEPVGATTIPRQNQRRPIESHRRSHNSEEDGDSVDSESELDSDGLEDFVERDEDSMGISHEQQPEALRGDDGMSFEMDSASMADASDEYGSVGTTAAEDTDFDLVDAPLATTADSLPATPNRLRIHEPEAAPRSTHSVIDLTALSDSPASLNSSPVPRPSFSRPSVVPGSLINTSQIGPENSTIAEITAWDIGTLEERSDKKRLVLKILRTSIEGKDYAQMRQYVMDVTRKELHDQMWKAMGCFCRGKVLQGVTEREWNGLVKFARLYACWSKGLFKHWSRPPDKIAEVLHKIVAKLDTQTSKRDLADFLDFVIKVLRRFPLPSSDSVSPKLTSEEEDEPEAGNTPHKKRKNAVQQSASAIKLRKSAQKRAEAQVEMERAFKERAIASQSQTDRLIVNPGEFGTEGAIHINPSIGSRIKPHQIEGVKFMWRELVEAGHTDAQGCLLAHTMGLGKTMQVITLLVTIAEAAVSPHEHIQAQIPPELRRMQALVLCPASLVNNWVDELYDWIPKSASRKFGSIGFINAEDGAHTRVRKILDWNYDGGILVISYEMFRNLFSERHTSKMSEEDVRELHEALLEGPSIIVADEAHKMKNVSSSIRQTVDRFRSKARVALTGSPLANNLTEYWSMIDWVSPGYLGSQKEFRAHYVEPIEEGLYKDSTPYEHRKALKKLRVLKNEIGPKISRANITALKDDLRPKVEFVITVPLTTLQEELYKLCIRQLLTNDKKKFTTTRMWQWMYLLNTLCSHPASFVGKLKDEQSRRDNKQRTVAEESDANEQQDVPPEDQSLPLPSSFIGQAMSIFDQAQAGDSSHHSFKMDILLQIVRLSRAAGDRVLVFSQQLSSLTYLETALTSRNYRFERLDGKTKMSNRPALMERFNRGEFDVFLVSTKAGGTGFNLQGANRVIILDCGFNPQHEEQAIGRAYRIGQKKEVFVYRMLAGGTFEPKIWNTALFKTQLASRVVDKQNPERHAAKIRDYFFEPTPVGQEDLADHQGKDGKVLDDILAGQHGGKDAGLRAITTTETLMTEDLDAVLNEQENEEVQKMIQAERLRKENPQAWEQYLRENPSIDDSRNHPNSAVQRALFSLAAARNGSAPIPSFLQLQSQPTPRPYIEFGAVPSGTAHSRTGGDQGSWTTPFAAFDNTRSEGLPSSDAGINNAGPSPASMRRPVPPKPPARNPLDVPAEGDSATNLSGSTELFPNQVSKPLSETRDDVPGNLAQPKSSMPLRDDKRVASPELGEDPPVRPGDNNSGPPTPWAKPSTPVAMRPLSLAPRVKDQEDPTNPSRPGDGPFLHAFLRRLSSPPRTGAKAAGHDELTAPSNQDGKQHSTASQLERPLTSPPKREVQRSISLSAFISDPPNSNANRLQSADAAEEQVRKTDTEKGSGSDSNRQTAGWPKWLPAAYAALKHKKA